MRSMDMGESVLEKMFEHNNWANGLIIDACLALSDEQLDAAPKSATMGSLRETLTHMVSSQAGYLRLLTLPVEERVGARQPLALAELKQSAEESGKALAALAADGGSGLEKSQLQTTDGFYVRPWVVMVQIINHATEHREQIKSMLSALGITPP